MALRNLRRYATPGVILAAVAVGVLLVTLAVLNAFWWSPAQAFKEAPESALTLIPGPSSTPPSPTALPPPTSAPTPTFAALASGEIGIVSYVQISGTGGVGLNIRSGPGLSGAIQFLGFDAEVFEVREGPQEADGFVWWYLVTPVDEDRAGWAAASFLSIVANP
jgi:hypothetical protein